MVLINFSLKLTIKKLSSIYSPINLHYNRVPALSTAVSFNNGMCSTLPNVMADWDGTSIATSFKLWTYLICSMNGISIARPYIYLRRKIQIKVVSWWFYGLFFWNSVTPNGLLNTYSRCHSWLCTIKQCPYLNEADTYWIQNSWKFSKPFNNPCLLLRNKIYHLLWLKK